MATFLIGTVAAALAASIAWAAADTHKASRALKPVTASALKPHVTRAITLMIAVAQVPELMHTVEHVSVVSSIATILLFTALVACRSGEGHGEVM